MAQGKKPIVWLSFAMASASSIRGFKADVVLENMDRAVDAMKRSNLGEPLPADRFPKEMYAKYKDKKEKNNPIFLMPVELGRFPPPAQRFCSSLILEKAVFTLSNSFNMIE